jgi:ankyrin repeat protein
MGYSLVHLSAYNNSEKCVEVLFQHILKSGKSYNDNNKMSKTGGNNKNDYEVIKAIHKRAILKEWVNQPTLMNEITNS